MIDCDFCSLVREVRLGGAVDLIGICNAILADSSTVAFHGYIALRVTFGSEDAGPHEVMVRVLAEAGDVYADVKAPFEPASYPKRHWKGGVVVQVQPLELLAPGN